MGRNKKDDDVIRVLRHKSNHNSYQFVSSNSIFKNEYLFCYIAHDRIKIRVADIDDTINVRKTSTDGSGRRITITSHNVELPLGYLRISTELSTEDELIILLKQ